VSRRPIAVACVALLTVAAGCGGVLGGDGTATREPYDVAPTPTPAATETREPPQASAAFREAVANHARALRAAGNVTVSRTETVGFVRVGGGEAPDTQSFRARADFDAGRYTLGSESLHEGDRFAVLFYQNATGAYHRARLDPGGAFRTYTVGPGTVTPLRSVTETVEFVGNRSVEFGFERNGTATVDGEEMARFTADDPGPFRGRFVDVEAVGDFEATALVDDRGIVRRFSYVLQGELDAEGLYVETLAVEFDGVGTTTVPTLDGVANATAAP
jgi:hypothetical protein